MEEKISRQEELLNLYLKNMQIIKWRIQSIEDIYMGRTHTSFQMTNTEFCVLQLRKILELIALSALVSNFDVYNEKLKHIEKMWNARLIIKDIERIHPNFYPHPIDIDPQNRFQWLEKQEPYLSKEQFMSVYDKCGKYLHENTLNMSTPDIDLAYENAWNNVHECIQLIINLLNTHTIQLYDREEIFYIGMSGLGNRPHGNIFTCIGTIEDFEQIQHEHE